jgi:hypothetical protein
MPVADHAIHPSTVRDETHRYGCNGRPARFSAFCLGTRVNDFAHWPFEMSHACQYDMSANDPRCDGCKHRRGA